MPKHAHPHHHDNHGNHEVSREESLDQAFELLKKFQLRRTKPREALLDLLIREHGPFTIDEIFRAVRKQDLDLVTVYRCMEAFEKIGLVRRCDFGDGVARFEFQPDPSHHHHHVICTSCRKTESLDSCELPTLEAEVKKLGYSEIRHSLEFFALCKDCRQKRE